MSRIMQSKITRIALAAMLVVAAPIGALAQNIIGTPDLYRVTSSKSRLSSMSRSTAASTSSIAARASRVASASTKVDESASRRAWQLTYARNERSA